MEKTSVLSITWILKYHKNPKISYIFEKKSVLSITCSKCKNEDEKPFKEEESFEILKT